MKIKFDRQEYMALKEIFDVGQLDDVTTELSEFSDDIEDMAYELAYTRYELAKVEARHNALVEAVKWEREFDETLVWLVQAGLYPRDMAGKYDLAGERDCARAEVDRLIANERAADCKGEG